MREGDGRATRGWLAGHFIEPGSVRSSTDVEIKWAIHPPRHTRADWTVGEQRTTMVILVDGRFRIDLTEGSVTLASAGDYLMWAGDRPLLAGTAPVCPRRHPVALYSLVRRPVSVTGPDCHPPALWHGDTPGAAVEPPTGCRRAANRREHSNSALNMNVQPQ
jgi:hypothetical protein